jgi:cell division protein FtsL
LQKSGGKMSEADGQIRIKVSLNTQEIDKDIQKLQEKLEKQNESLNRQSIVVEKLTSRYEILYKKAQEMALPNLESQSAKSIIKNI